jgi:hypothetical protein
MKKITKTTKKEMPKAKKQAKKKATKVVMARFEYTLPLSVKKKLNTMAKNEQKPLSKFITDILTDILYI